MTCALKCGCASCFVMFTCYVNIFVCRCESVATVMCVQMYESVIMCILCMLCECLAYCMPLYPNIAPPPFHTHTHSHPHLMLTPGAYRSCAVSRRGRQCRTSCTARLSRNSRLWASTQCQKWKVRVRVGGGQLFFVLKLGKCVLNLPGCI